MWKRESLFLIKRGLAAAKNIRWILPHLVANTFLSQLTLKLRARFFNKIYRTVFLDFFFDPHYFRVRADFQFIAIQTMYVLEAPAVSGNSLFPISRREKEEGGEETPEAKGKKGRGGSDKAEKRKEKQSNVGFGFEGGM